MNNIERLKLELRKAEEELEQKEFFVHWLQMMIGKEEIEELCKEKSEVG